MDDFGIKYVGKEHIDHLVAALKKDYTITEDWGGKLYCVISLEWNYKKRYVDISMPGYIKKAIAQFKHTAPTKQQHSPFRCAPKKYGAVAQEPPPPR